MRGARGFLSEEGKERGCSSRPNRGPKGAGPFGKSSPRTSPRKLCLPPDPPPSSLPQAPLPKPPGQRWVLILKVLAAQRKDAIVVGSRHHHRTG